MLSDCRIDSQYIVRKIRVKIREKSENSSEIAKQKLGDITGYSLFD
tara:strand:- start:4108 stop:4245 length:138 start_codon:yes stop_codon:yes gene_type:complete